MSLKFPSEYRYEIVKSDQKSTTIRIDIKNSDQLKLWLENFRICSGVGWIYRRGIGSPKRCSLSRHYDCQHSSYQKSKSKSDDSGRNTGCKAKIKIRIQKITPKTKRNKYVKDGLICEIIVHQQHNHSAQTADSLRQIRPTTETQKNFEEYFACGMRPADALNHHRNLLKKQKSGKSAEPALANSALCPRFGTVKYWHNSIQKKLFKVNIPNLIDTKQKEYAELGYRIAHSSDYNSIAIQTPIMRRVSEMKSSEEVRLRNCTEFRVCTKISALSEIFDR